MKRIGNGALSEPHMNGEGSYPLLFALSCAVLAINCFICMSRGSLAFFLSILPVSSCEEAAGMARIAVIAAPASKCYFFMGVPVCAKCCLMLQQKSVNYNVYF